MKTKPKPTVGQRLFSLHIGNISRNGPQALTPVVVTKIGRKYFTVENEERLRNTTEFHVEGWMQKTDYSADYALYESEQQYADEKEARTICDKIGKAFECGRNFKNINIETLRKIEALIYP
jgi:phosphotransferase system IIA component